METPEFVEIKIVASEEFVQDIKKELETNKSENKVEILSSGAERDPTFLGMNFLDPQNILFIVKTLYFVGNFSHFVYNYIKSKKSRIVICTPTRNFEIVFKNGLTEDEVRTAIKALFGIT